MAANLYSEIPDNLKKVADVLEDRGYTYKIYNYGKQFNAEDSSGVIQEFFPTTGTIKFHKANGWKQPVYVLKDSNLETFMSYLDRPEEIQKFFFQR